MVKFYIIFFVIYSILYIVYVYRDDGSEEHEENTIRIGLFGLACLLLFMFLIVMEPKIKDFINQIKNSSKDSVATKKVVDDIYGEGYLKEGVLWTDKNNDVHRNLRYVKIEIIKGRIVMADGSEVKPFEFLEGENIGVWGCTNENSFTINPSPSQISKSARVDRVIYASPEKSCTCVVNVEDIDKVIEVANMKSALLYDLFVRLGTVIVIRQNTKVACYFSGAYRGFVPVVFYEGKYKGRRVYVPERRLQE